MEHKKLTITLEAQCGNCGHILSINTLDHAIRKDYDKAETEMVLDDVAEQFNYGNPRKVATTSYLEGLLFVRPCNNCCTVDKSKSIY